LIPKDALAHHNLGNALQAQGKLDGAIAHYQKAIAIAHFQKTIALDPMLALAHTNLALAHYNLGAALRAKGRLDAAIGHYEQALRLDPKYAQAHVSLGIALADKGRAKEAEAAYRQALRLKPDYPEAHCNLGHVLRRLGYFEEALACLKRGHELGSKQPGWRYPSAQWVREAERLVALDRKLATVLKGQSQPAEAAECLAFAQLCFLYKKLPRAAARFCADAFAAEPNLAADLRSGHRYHAACAAALAAAGQGEDAGKLTEEERAHLRRQALDWLRADLAAWAKVLEPAKPEARTTLRQKLQHWQKGPDLAGLRDKAALDKLPAAERDDWQRLWADVDALLQRAQEK
jgi:Tfp pilus assembly protein PilF